MINCILIYFLTTGIIMYCAIDKELKDLNKYEWEIPEEKRESVRETKQLLFEHLGTAYSFYLPFIYVFGMLLGWVIIPITLVDVIITRVLKLFK